MRISGESFAGGLGAGALGGLGAGFAGGLEGGGAVSVTVSGSGAGAGGGAGLGVSDFVLGAVTSSGSSGTLPSGGTSSFTVCSFA